jgi:sugar-specific transcriptional regulator TrmB
LNGELELSLKKIFKTLVDLGLSETESRVYILVSFKGPMNVRKIIEELRISKQQIYPILRKLENKKILEISNSRPAIVTAVSFEIILNMLIDSRINEAKNIQEKKAQLISTWQEVIWKNHN